MATFTGTNADETITPTFVSSTVKTSGGTLPSDAADIIDAGGGNDMIDAGGGDDVILAGAGNDTVIGGRGNDVALLGSGNDTFIWNPGDGSDVVEGQGGFDTLLFNGANVNENIDISANGSRVRFTRDVANITMDLNGIERIEFDARGGADKIVVNDLSGTDVKQVAVDLSAQPGTGTGDGAADMVMINATAGDDKISVSGSATATTVGGLAATVTVTGAEANNDKLVVNGLGGADTLQVNGTNAADTIGVVTDGQNVAVTGVGNIIVEANGVENVVINASGGDDVVNASGLISGLTQLTINGGAGNDMIIGSQGADMLLGGSGNDTVIGGRGDDVALMGSGDDTFIWNPGDGSDVVEGQGGFDTLLFNGANVAENIDISANGSRVLFTRDIANITMDLNGIERIEFNALGGADKIVVNDLSGTDVKQVAVDLSVQPGSGVGDGAADTVIVNGRDANDHVSIVSDGTAVVVNGLPAQVTVTGAEAANDTLVVNGLDGNDKIDASGLNLNQMRLQIDGGAGNDTIIGSSGADMLLGGDGNDLVIGGAGNDVALLGAGDDTFVWNPGDGSDIVEGQDGDDTLQFNGANINENIGVVANGSRVLLTRDVGNVTIDLNGIEHIQINAAGGSDNLVVNDLSGTDVAQVAIDLAGTPGGHSGDGQADTVTVNATAGADVISVEKSGGVIMVSGLAETVTIAHADPGLDVLSILGGQGDDVIDASNLPGNQIGLHIDGGAGNDVILGSQGSDTVIGGQGNDVAVLGGGDDTFVWNPGDGSDVVDGGPGFDTLLFNGANVSENVAISANGSHALFTRNVANISMDLNAVERIDFNALGGADNIVVNDLTGTGVKQVAIDLAGVLGGNTGDGAAADTVTVNGNPGNNQITVTNSGTALVVDGLSAQVTVDHAEAANDRLIINGSAGNDTINASAVASGMAPLTLAGGAGNDVLIGGAGNDTFLFTFGDAGKDVVQGFQAHGVSAQGDIVALAGFADQSFAQAVADGHIAQSGADVAISDGTHVVATLQNVLLTSLQANDFAFG
jgi:Ca2+-binding RTX toxin-like protein